MTLVKYIKGPYGYAIANLVSAASGFILVPLLTRSMSTAAIGSWIVMESALILLGQILMLGLGHAVLQQIGEAKVNHRDVLLSHIRVLAAVCAVVFVFGVFGYFLTSSSNSIPFSLNVVIEVMLGYLVYYARASNDIRKYYITAVFRPVLLVIAWAGYLYVQTGGSWTNGNQSVDTFLWIRCIAAGFVFLIAGMLTIGKQTAPIKDSFNKHLVLDAIKFGIPLTIASALVASQDFLVRYLLSNAVKANDLLGYYVHLKAVALVGNFVVTPLAIWWGAERYRAMAKGQIYFHDHANNIMLKCCLLYAFLSAVFMALLPIIINIFSPGMQSNVLLASVLLAVPFTQMLVHLTNAGLMRKGVTKYQILVQLSSMATVCLGCFLLLRWLSVGVALAFLSANVVAFILSYMLSVRFYPVKYQLFKSIAAFSVVFIVIYIVFYLMLRVWGGGLS